ncbi:MAG: metal-dependent hydrolase, partial [Planctomycetia bacterium]
MAGFKTHVTASSLLGVGYGIAGHYWLGTPLETSILAGGLCGVAGMLPDLDSDSGRPVKESLAFAAAVIPMMLVERFREFGMTTESIVLVTGLIYIIVRFGLGEVFTRLTVHRGMFHSFPAALIFGEVAFLVSTGDLNTRFYKAGAIVAGYLCHLVLDEI